MKCNDRNIDMNLSDVKLGEDITVKGVIEDSKQNGLK